MHLPNFRAFQTLLDLGADIHQADRQGRTIVHMSLHWNRFDLFESVREVLDIRSKDAQGCEPYHHAASGDCIQGLRWLLDAGVPPDTTDSSGWTALHWASYYGRSEAAEELLRSGCPRDAVDLQGRTALDIVLLVRPADIDIVDVLDDTLIQSLTDRVLERSFAEASWVLFLDPDWMRLITSDLGLEEKCDLQWDAGMGPKMRSVCDFEYATGCNERWTLTDLLSLWKGLLVTLRLAQVPEMEPPIYPLCKLAFCSSCFFVSFSLTHTVCLTSNAH